MSKRLCISIVFMLALCLGVNAQRPTDKLDRGLVAVKTTNGVFCSWRIFGEEYYDVTYNIYRDGTKLNSEPLTVSNYQDNGGTTASSYTVSAVVRGTEQSQCAPANVLNHKYLEVQMNHGDLTSTYIPNDACCADVDGDGELEILLKFDNASWANASYPRGGHNGEYFIIEVYKLNGQRLWWIDLGPNMADFQNNEQNIVAYDWDDDGKAEAVMRASDGTVIHKADGSTYVIGDPSKNYLGYTNTGQWFVHEGSEFLVYMNGETGEPYHVQDYPLRRLEDNETDLNAAWGDGYGHRSTKHFFGAPVLDGRKPSIFLARGIYTRHKMVAYDVNPYTHKLQLRWRWNNNSPGSQWYGQGYHNFGIADVDWDGRDEIVFGSMVIDDNGHGLSTTGLGHGDAQHCSDFNPYAHGQEIYCCNEDQPSNNYRDATTSKIYYRMAGGNDDGRAMCGNFSNSYPGAMGASAHDAPISCVTNDHVDGMGGGFDLNFRLYWDGDLLEETFNGTATRNSNGRIAKYGTGVIETLEGSFTNNDTKATPCYQGDILGDWREEVIMRTAANNIRIYTTTIPTKWRNYTLWHDMQYRQAMVWQMCGYNQPPHTSYFLGELEKIYSAPPALTMTDRTEVKNNQAITAEHNDAQVLLAETNDMTVEVTDGAAPYILFDNAPTWVQGHDNNDRITTTVYTHTLTGGAFGGTMRLVKQGDGILVLPHVTQTYSGPTDVWAGTLVFDGTMEQSRVWLNRFAVLSSDGGTFNKGIQMDYAAVLRPGGEDKAGFVTTDSLILNFGAKVEFDIFGADGSADCIKANVLTVEKKTWQNGPEYNAPVFHIVTHFAEGTTSLPEGKYLLGEFETIKGNLSDVIIEGIGTQKANILREGGKVYLDVKGLREPSDITWTGSVNSNWDLADTENFKSSTGGESNIFVTGDKVVFNDDAENTNVVITMPVSPSVISFENNVKEYHISGESIIGDVTINKIGAANVNINNVNAFNGPININGGRLTVASLANATGVELGALGGVSNTISLGNGGVLAGSSSITTTQPIKIERGGGGIHVDQGQTFATESSISSTGKANLTKTGPGTLRLGSNASFGALYVMAGEVVGSENGGVHQYPDSVVLNGGVLRDPDNIYSYSSNKTHVVVPEGKKASWYLDARCNYTGTLSGAGTLSVYATSIRNLIQGNWSQFEGTLNVGTVKTGSYDPVFYFANSNGLKKATVNVTSNFNSGFPNDGVINGSNNVSMGNLKGNGTLSGKGRYTIGFLNEDVTFTGKLDGCVITKVGSGMWTLSLPSNYGSGSTEVKGGILNLNHANANTLFFGTNNLTVSDSGVVAGRAQLHNIYLQAGGGIRPGSATSSYPVGSIKIKTSLYAYEGSHLDFFILNAKNSSTSRSYLEVEGTLSLQGVINVTTKGYTPQEGDEIILWTAGSVSGAPTAINLPDISEYNLVWDTSDLMNTTGVIRVVASTKIAKIDNNAPTKVSVYRENGAFMATFDAIRSDVEKRLRRYGRGTYILRITDGRRSESIKITIK